MNMTTTQFLRSDPAMYTSPSRTYARVGIRDPARMYTYVAVFSFLHPGRCMYVYMLRARLYYDTCAPLHPPVYMYVNIRNQKDNATYASTRWVPTVRHFLACKDVAGGSEQSGGESFCFFARTHFLACEGVVGGSQQSRGKRFFSQNTVAHPVGPAVRWRNNYFSRNKEALPCCGRGPSCQPLHIQSTFDGSCSLTTLTTPRREHQGGGRRRGLGRGRRRAG